MVAEVNKGKWDMIRAAGASEVIDPSVEGAGRALRKSTRGGIHGVVDFVGSSASFAFGFDALAIGGKLVSVGLFGGSTQFAPAMLGLKAVSVIGSLVGNLDDMREVMKIARSGALPELPIATRPLAEVNEALSDLRQGRV